MVRFSGALAPFLLLSGLSCGDVSHLDVSVAFSDPAIEEATQQLLFVVRAPNGQKDPCVQLWGQPDASNGEFSRLIDYPNASDVMAAPLKDGNYAVYLYAYPTRFSSVGCAADADCGGEQVCSPIAGGQTACLSDPASVLAGGCGAGLVAEDGSPLVVLLERAP